MRLSLIHESDAEKLHQALAVVYGTANQEATPPAMRPEMPQFLGALTSGYNLGQPKRNAPQTIKIDQSGRQNGAGIPWKQRHRRFMGISDAPSGFG